MERMGMQRTLRQIPHLKTTKSGRIFHEFGWFGQNLENPEISDCLDAGWAANVRA